jgi:hypothetical protein
LNKKITIHIGRQEDKIRLLEDEIALLEKELKGVESDLNSFEYKIRFELRNQILRINELTVLYKKQKGDKKSKRLDQKKKGRNYKEPKELKKTNRSNSKKDEQGFDEQQKLKRLYKEAIIHVHPDKFVNTSNDKTERANSLTVQLNDIYKRGNIEELNQFHEHIISGNAMSHVAFKPESIINPKALLAFLQNKKNEMIISIEQIKLSQTFLVLKTYSEPLKFIEELRLQFEERIAQLEKRTRKGV